MKNLIKQYKLDLKELAKEIRQKKNTRKEHRDGYVPGLFKDRYTFRHKHIAYCLMRGRTYDQIEKPINNKLSWYDWREILKLMQVDVPKTSTEMKEAIILAKEGIRYENARVSEERPSVVA